MDYTWSQFTLFAQSAERLRRERERQQFTHMMIATRGSEESVKSVLDSFK
jgi:hypothetical protein